MAVYKSRRKDAAAQFVADARELRKATVRIARKFPASYKYVTTGPLLQLASEVYMNALKGNSIYVHKDMSERDYELRHRYLAAATASADALLGEITFCYELVDDGNNFFRNKGGVRADVPDLDDTGEQCAVAPAGCDGQRQAPVEWVHERPESKTP